MTTQEINKARNEKDFCRLMKPEAQYVANEIERIHDYKVDVSSPFVLKRSACA